MYGKYQSLDSAVTDLFGPGRTIDSRRNVAGGDINEACILTLDDGSTVFMKSNTVRAFANFESEARGLEAIRRTKAIGTPAVLGLGVDRHFSFLLLEHIAGAAPVKNYWETFASELAAMHRAELPAGTGFGFEEDNWIGERKQVNTPHGSWTAFFRDCRLKPQLDAAKGYLDRNDRKKAEYLLSHLDLFLVEPERPSLVHGDLWSGNMMTGNDGKGWLIDPAVYYGHPEADLAMTQLFGGFSHQFYEAYAEAGCLDPGYRDRKDLYNLYHLLNHLNMFGSGYLPSVRRILSYYAQGA